MIIFGGGIIPLKDMDELQKIGISKLFGPGTPTSDIISWTKGKFNIKNSLSV